MSRKRTPLNNRARRPGVTVVGHDESTVTAFHRGGNMDITSYDKCKVTLFEGNTAPAKAPQDAICTVKPKIDWTKWGTIIGAVTFVATILIAVLS